MKEISAKGLERLNGVLNMYKNLAQEHRLVPFLYEEYQRIASDLEILLSSHKKFN